MKKTIYSILIFFIFFTTVTAKECYILTGDGTNIGDEIACGTEHFYVISNDGDKVRMLSKYNLFVGYAYEKVTFSNNIVSTNRDSVYDSPEVRSMMEKGYLIDERLYDYDSSTGNYTIYGALMYKYLPTSNYKSIFFDKKKDNVSEIINDPKSKELLLNGYSYSSTISNQDGLIGATFYKSDYYTFETIFFEAEQITNREFYNRKDVKEKLDEGYLIDYRFYDSTSSTSNGETTYDFYGVTFYKKINYEYITYITNTDYSTSTELITYLKNNTDYQEKINEGYDYNTYYYQNFSSGNSKYIGISLSKKINNENDSIKVLQDETAIGAHGTEEGKPAPTEIGVVSFDVYDLYGYEIANGKEYDYAYYNYEFSTEEYDESKNTWYYAPTKLYELELYEETLKNMDYNIKDISLPTIEDINNIVKNVTSNELPLDTWAEESWETINSNSLLTENVYKVGSLKDYLTKDYSWLWATTYWTQTMYVTGPRNYGINGYVYFVDTLGNICADYNCPLSIGAGIRPIITMSADDLVFKIETKTDGNGTIKPSKDNERSGNEVTFIVTPNEGYVLSEVKVTDKNGNVVTFTDYKFTMPSADVLIEASFVKEEPNPPTSSINIGIAIILSTISVVIFKNYKKKADWLNN